MTIRITGMNSGLDTESIITELASARSVKVQNIEKEQTKLSWKLDAWKELNSKIYSFYTDVLSDMRFDYAYGKKKTTVSDPNVVSVVTSGEAMSGVQSLKVKQLAKAGYLTGTQIKAKAGASTRLSDLEGMEWLKNDTTTEGSDETGKAAKTITFKVRIGGKDSESAEEKEITLSGSDTLNDVANKLKEAGLDAKFDANLNRFFVASKETGDAADFTFVHSSPSEPKEWEKLTDAEKTQQMKSILGDEAPENWADLTDEDKQQEVKDAYNTSRTATIEANKEKEAESKANFTKLMQGLGMVDEHIAKEYLGVEITDKDIEDGIYAKKIDGSDAVISLNGVKFTSSKNTFEINGLTLTVQKETGDDEVTLTTQQDTDGIYDMIKNFFTKYNELINEIDKLYNAESASKYDPLTKDEKEAMSDKEVEEWEKKIKDSLLRRDSTLSGVGNVLKEAMLSTFISDTNGKNDGKDKYLSYFGIETLGYFKAKDNEKNAYHINGDADDTSVKNNEDKLRAAIANEPDAVVEFFKKLSNNLYDKLTEKMERTDYSSSFTVYNDKQMETELKNYESKISKEQEKLNDYIDRWYEKFSQMEVALSKLNSKESSISSLFG